MDCAGSGVEEEVGAGLTVIPYGQGGLEMDGFDAGAAIESGVDGAEAQNLGFGPTGGGAILARMDLAQDRVNVVPKISRLVVADEVEGLRIAYPVESAAEFGGKGG